MPRLIQAVPKYRKHRASGQAIVTINGRDHYLGPHNSKSSKLEYDRLVTEWLSSGRSASFGAAQPELTIVELVADYLLFAKEYYGDRTHGTFATMKRVARPLKALYGRTPAAEFGVVQFKAVRQAIIAEDHSRGHVNELMSRMVAIFRWGAAEGKIPANVAQTLAIIPGLRKGRTTLRETEPVRPVEPKIVEATLPHLSPIVAAMVRFQLLTGARPGEVCKLRPCDVDRSGEVWTAKPAEHKTAHFGKDRTIFIGPQAQDILRPYLLRDAIDCCFSPGESAAWWREQRAAARKTPLSCGNRAGTNRKRKPARKPGGRFKTGSYAVAITRACIKARIEHWSPNQLRHAAATEVRREFGLEAAQIVLGHSKADVTQVYAERDLAKGLEVAKRIG
ncbi:tyrosine-type recombinase/integrase [Lacipirellula limnantheis]|uniref:Site-specific tyrosine recombinase XerC n=1 Tax=Lacipirellula limnantheis TaxID=2528024 RepID=A0A517U2I8_9BACT|nr:site-specific integrase [Lacipirellula limnantheis]QDT74839.1 site-specific tyrosine recombinase XerC [Lacipirellula limnantheis]